ncbi:LemA family protein [Mycobacteroides abscessus subsp. abscessus]|nr:LemA family protein [Mycobacteroides abscessus subsp. abscessus]
MFESMIGLVFLLVLIGAVGAGIFFYNKVTQGLKHIQESWYHLGVDLQRRHDVATALLNTAGNSVDPHRAESLSRSRNHAIAAAQGQHGVTQQGHAERELAAALNQFLAAADQNPNLQGNHNYQAQRAEVATINGRLTDSRRRYNTVARAQNQLISQFPGNLIAGIASAAQAEYFQGEEPDAFDPLPPGAAAPAGYGQPAAGFGHPQQQGGGYPAAQPNFAPPTQQPSAQGYNNWASQQQPSNYAVPQHQVGYSQQPPAGYRQQQHPESGFGGPQFAPHNTSSPVSGGAGPQHAAPTASQRPAAQHEATFAVAAEQPTQVVQSKPNLSKPSDQELS